MEIINVKDLLNLNFDNLKLSSRLKSIKEDIITEFNEQIVEDFLFDYSNNDNTPVTHISDDVPLYLSDASYSKYSKLLDGEKFILKETIKKELIKKGWAILEDYHLTLDNNELGMFKVNIDKSKLRNDIINKLIE